jgi:glycyl-tRNA synthetase (class II)
LKIENFKPRKTPSEIVEISKSYDNEIRTIQKKFRVTEQEDFLLKYKMSQAKIENFSLYARNMCLAGFTITTDFSDLKNLVTELGRIGNNINQLAHRANISNSVSKEDFQELSVSYHELTQMINEELLFRMRRARDAQRFI